MQRKLAIGLAVGGCALIALAAEQRSEASSEKLLSGKDLSGWRCYLADHMAGMEDVWSLRDGVLVCKGEPIGYLYTKKAYKNFKLHVEWRWADKKGGNSGVLMRIQGPPRPLPRSYEAQLQSGGAGAVFGLQGMPLTGDASRFKKIEKHELAGDINAVQRIRGAEKESGEWNAYDIVVDGPRIRVTMNGELVNEADGAEVVAGPIALQSEGGEVHFRNIVLTPLPN